jgi:Polysaccharide biosynthesis protein
VAEPQAPPSLLKRHAQLGMVALGLRSALQNVVVLVANVYLARWLDPRDFGIFGILQFALSFFRLVSDTGLGAALVQQKEAPAAAALSTLWWLELAFGVVLTGASFGLAPLVPLVWDSVPREAVWLLPGLAVGLLFTMLQSIPFLVLERQVRFGWVGTLERRCGSPRVTPVRAHWLRRAWDRRRSFRSAPTWCCRGGLAASSISGASGIC